MQEHPGGCWEWTGTKIGRGYAEFWDGRKNVYAHRWIYEYVVGAIPAGMTIDHVRERGCIMRHCVNPAHLEVVTVRENNRRAKSWEGGAEHQRRKTHCPHGHAYDAGNTIHERGQRVCRRCRRERKRRRNAAHDV